MSELNNIRKVYFIGIGGIGMSALARYFVSRGVEVSGYDKTRTTLTQDLEDINIRIHYEINVDLIPKDVDVVVYTPAIPVTNAEKIYYIENGFKIVKRSDVLQWITESSFNICVAGTHGKTTITTMIAHILRHSGYGCNAFLGGISNNYNTNFWSNERNVVVVEADEYDRSFLKLIPDIAVITAMDADHLDIYGTPEEVENAFIQFCHRIKRNGCLVNKYGLKRQNELKAAHQFSYDRKDINADVHSDNLRIGNGTYMFDVVAKNWIVKDISLHMGGLHNIENAVAAITIAKYLDIKEEKIRDSIGDFKGVRRRFEYVIKNEKCVLIDDYAHHPAELKALIDGVRSLFPDRKMTVVFQPHLYSRTNDLADEFAKSLDRADEVILLPIYPARELPIKGVTSELILNKMKLKQKRVLSKENLKDWIKVVKPVLLIMAGAGDIDSMVLPVKAILLNN